MRIGLVTGFWSTNVGNAFFHLGAHELLRSLAQPEDEIYWLNNMPAYWRLFNKRNPKNAVRGIGEPKLDVFVMVGPFLRRTFPDVWRAELLRLKSQGTKIVMIGLGSMQHDQRTREVCRSWFTDVQPDFIATRDQATFQGLEGLGLNLVPSICPAFFVSQVLPGPVSRGEYIVLNCEKSPEPDVFPIETSAPERDIVVLETNRGFAVRPKNSTDGSYLERFAELAVNLKSFFRWGAGDRYPGLKVFRTIHRSNPFVLRRMFSRPNTMVSDVPYPYLLAYASAQFVVTDRVHTAVAAITFGTPVVFLGRTKRQGLLEAAGAKIASNGLVVVDRARLKDRKMELESLIARNVFGIERETPPHT